MCFASLTHLKTHLVQKSLNSIQHQKAEFQTVHVHKNFVFVKFELHLPFNNKKTGHNDKYEIKN